MSTLKCCSCSRSGTATRAACGVAVVTQRRNPCEGREYHDRTRAEDKSSKAAMRALKRQISNAVYRALVADAPASRTDQ